MPASPRELAQAVLTGWLVKGVANTGGIDLTNERLNIPTAHFDALLTGGTDYNGSAVGVFNDGHKSGVENELGPIVHGEIEPQPDDSNYLVVWGILDPTVPRAREIRAKLLAGKKIGLSVEGSRGLEKRAGDGATELLHSLITRVAITENPCDPATHIALIKGDAIKLEGEATLATFGGLGLGLSKDFSLATNPAAQIENLSPVLTQPAPASGGQPAPNPRLGRGKLWGGCKGGKDCYHDGTLAKGKPGIRSHLEQCQGMSTPAATDYINALIHSLLGKSG